MKLEIKGIHKSYHQNKKQIQILKNLNLSVQSPQQVAILGQSGSGKSTFLAMLAGLDLPDQGQILFDTLDLTKLNQMEITNFRANNIGIVFQQFHLVSHLSALENVMLPLEILKKPAAESSAKNVLNEMGLSHRLGHLPGQLSGGECQRVAIARALVTNPKILLADEPSGNLDTQTGHQVMEYLFKSVKTHQNILLLVTHSEELAQRCDQIFRLIDGQLQQVKTSG